MLEISEYRARAREILERATNGAHGRPESDPIYQRITEGRDVGAYQRSYSSCGDLPAHLWYELGVRCSFVNRRENVRYGYRIGRNIALLSGEKVDGKPQGVPGHVRRPLSPESQFSCGDVLVVWNKDDTSDAHTLVAYEHLDGALLSADYGQPGGALKTRAITQRQVFDKVGAASIQLFLGSKQIRRWIPLEFVLDEAQRRGEFVDTSEPSTTPIAAPLPVVTDWPRLTQGDSGPAVRHLQERLNLHRVHSLLVVDGGFGSKTRDAVEAFQRANGLKPDGIVGKIQTWPALERNP